MSMCGKEPMFVEAIDGMGEGEFAVFTNAVLTCDILSRCYMRVCRAHVVARAGFLSRNFSLK